MKTNNVTNYYSISRLVISFLLFTTIFTSCSKDDVVKSNKKQITSFVFLLTNNPIDENIVGLINESTKTITATMAAGTSLTGLLPEIIVSDGATVSPNSAQDFTNPLSYTVTAEDGSSTVYTATISIALSQRDILQIILDVNPGNTIGWDLEVTPILDSLKGVTTNTSNEIIELDLANTNLTQIPPEIGQLSQLRKLLINFNDITAIPPEIGQLKNLKVLYAFHNELTALPTEIGQLVNLDELVLYNNYIIELPPAIEGLKNLIFLNLNANNLTSFPPEIGSLTNLTSLLAEINTLTTLPPEIGNLTNLTTLRLEKNDIKTLPPEIGMLSNLISLDLNVNNLISLPQQIGRLTKLTNLVLRNNNLTSLPEEFGFLTELGYLGIKSNNLSSIPRSICYLEAFNGLTISKDAEVVCSTSSTEKDALISLYAANPGNTLGWGVDNYPGVSFSPDGSPVIITANNMKLLRFPDNFSALASLEIMHISQNAFAFIPGFLGEMNSFTVLTFHDTNISTVPASFGQLTNLALLTLTGNPITSIPQSVCNLQQSNGGILTILTDPGEGCQ